ncbi:hypothetical protein ACOMHN_041912 [Nucella lapillus]
MATLKRNDILRKHTNRGRPPKPVKERQLKQRAAYQWRDARRIYLAGSFERWRKLKTHLRLVKDSSLAWHLLETHDKGCNECSTPTMIGDDSMETTDQDDGDSATKKNPAEFVPALKKMLRHLCYTYLHFDDCVELVGLICVEIDHKSKDNHSIREVVRRGLVPKERTHERPQCELEANEAELVMRTMSRLARKDVVTMGGKDSMNGQVSAGGDDAETTLGSGTELTVSASHHRPQEQDSESRTSWGDGGEYCEDTVSKDMSESTDNTSIVGPSEQGDTLCSMSVSHTTEIHGQPLHSYDETDHHAAMTAGSSHQVDCSNSSVVTSSKDGAHSLSTSWLTTQNHSQQGMCLSAGSPTHDREQCMLCLSRDVPNKVVVSGDGMVSHVVHNGPLSRQVYRIDLSNHQHTCDIDLDLGLHGGLPKDPAGEQSRDRAASIESTDSFMEVGIKSQINNAQRLLASPSPPTDQSKPSPVPSPVVSLVADSSLRATFDAFPPPHSPHSDSALATDSLAVECPSVHFDASSSHPSVIKQVTHPPDKAASHKTDPPPACSSQVSFPSEERNASPRNVSDGDLPLDMSVVKEEGDSTDHSAPDERQGVHQGPVQQDERPVHHDTEDACSTSNSPPSSMQSEAAAAAVTAAARDAAQLLSSSSVQHLQHYTDRLLQHQQQMNVDLSLLHATYFNAADGDDAARSKKRKLCELDDSGEFGKGGPWPRKDMTQKEEYQYLERDPFMDFAEMTRIFPNMQQRTFYRWKRRIKDQFIYVEQHPALTFAEFSQYFPQVREQIFDHWRDLLSKGHRFLGDAGKSSLSSFGDVSALSGGLLKMSGGVECGGGSGGGGVMEAEGGGSSKSDNFVSQYIFLQKNLTMDVEQFAKLFPDVPQQLFYVWRKQIYADFMKLQANPKMTYQEFRKQASVTQDVFSLWKAHMMLMTTTTTPTPAHLMSTCSSLVPPSTSLTTPPTPTTLPPVSLLARGKNLGADFATWYASYAPLLGPMALPFWNPLSLMSNPSLTTTSFPTLRESSGIDRETDKDQQSREKVLLLERLKDNDSSRSVVGDSESSGTAPPDKTSDTIERTPSPNPQVAPEREGSGEGAVGYRGRRQSLKPEHYYYLLHPDTSYLALTRVFPGVSAQRYGRWKRKVSSALAFLEREPECSDRRFELYFPNVPDEILASWRERVRHGHSRLMPGDQESGEELSSQPVASTQQPMTSLHQPLTSPSPALSAGGHSRDSSAGGGDTSTMGEELSTPTRNGDSDRLSEQRFCEMMTTRESLTGPSPRKPYKSSREEYLFVQRYPSVDLTTFTTYYPTISVRTFYRWRAEVHKAISLLRAKPTLSLHQFLEEHLVVRERFPELSQEVFAAWQGMVREEGGGQEAGEGGSGTSSQGNGEETTDNLMVPSHASLLQQQPHTEASREERETSSAEPVGEGQQNSQVASHDEDNSHPHGRDPSGGGGRSRYRQEQLLVHMNPYLEHSEMQRTYPGVTQRTFQRWKMEVQQIMTYMRDHPEVPYEDIASAVPGVSFQAFHMWQQLILAEKSLPPPLTHKTQQDSGGHYGNHGEENRNDTDSSRQSVNIVCESMDTSSQEKSDVGNRCSAEAAGEVNFGPMGNEDEHQAGKARRQTRDEFIEVMLNPAMDYSEFARRFGTVSQRTFYRWRAHIRDWRATIRADPQLDYTTFSRHARDVPEYVFKAWQDWESRMDHSHHSQEDLDGNQAESSQSSGTVHNQVAAPTTAQSGSSETGKSGSKQLDLMLLAYDYYQCHPTVDFKDLSAIFPCMSMDMYQQWKKVVDVKMEYIRSIPSTNFEDFNRIFPDVKEPVFNILKTSVLSQNSAGDAYYLADSAGAGDVSSSCLPAMQMAYSSTSQPVFPEVRTKHDEASDVSSLQGSESECAQQVVYPSTTPSPHAQLGGGVMEGLSVITTMPSVVCVKQEASPTTSLPSFTETVSNLSNLSRLNAMLQQRLPGAATTSSLVSAATTTPTPTPTASAVLYPPHASVTATTTAAAAASVNSTTLASVVGNCVQNELSGDSLQKALSGDKAASRHIVEKALTGHIVHKALRDGVHKAFSGHSAHKALSGHKALSASPITTASSASLYPSPHLYPSASAEPANPALEEGGGSVGGGFEDLPAPSREDKLLDTPGHSSQRQRKLQREEYMFVEQNPDVDVQEFLARFPGVSLRTFYRWKREIREEQARGILGGFG